MQTQRALSCLVACLPIAWVASCGPSRQPPAHATAPSASSAPLSFSPSSGSPLDATFAVGACTVSLGASPGSTYAFAASERDKAVEPLRAAIVACWQRPAPVQGTVYLSAQLDASGQLSDPVASPGGAVPTDAAVCLTDRLSKLKLPAPSTAPASLLVLLESSCSQAAPAVTAK